MSRIDARNGAFGIIPGELDGAIVTNDFPVFAVDGERICAQYLRFVTTTPQFRDYCQTLSKGTTNRQRMDEQTFLAIPIPLPSLAEQKRLVAAHAATVAKAEEAETRANAREQEAARFLESALGLQAQAAKPDFASGKLHFVRFVGMDRWDIVDEVASMSTKHPLVMLGSISTSIHTGTTPPTARRDYFDGDIPFFTPADLGPEPVLVQGNRTLSHLALVDKKARVFEKDSLLFVGIGSSIGKVGIVGVETATANQQITGIFLDRTKACVRFVHAWLDANKELSTREKAQTTLPILSQERILRIPVPLPPLSEQERIVARLDELRAQSRAARAEAATLREAAATVFSAALFAANPSIAVNP